ncbi:MAG: EamA family transporter [Nitrospirae bacterium]|nr:EamA family transporter [Nitrospirota bacterium]
MFLKHTGHLKIALAIVIWSSLGVFVRNVEMPTAGVVFYPSFFAMLFQGGILYKRKEISFSSFKPPAPVFYLLGPCALLNTFLYFYAFTHTTIANAVLTHYTAPIFVALMAPLLLREKSTKAIWLAILISSTGLWLMLGGLSFGSKDFNGILAGTVSGLTYAVIVIILRGISNTHRPLFVVFIQNAVISLILLPLVVNMHVSLQSLMYLLAMGAIHSTLAPLLYVLGFKTVKANEAAVLGYLEPVGAIILALIFFNEIPTSKALLGGAMILLSGFLILKDRDNC